MKAGHEIGLLKDELHQLKADNQDLTAENRYQPTHHCIVYSIIYLLIKIFNVYIIVLSYAQRLKCECFCSLLLYPVWRTIDENTVWC